MKQQTIRRSESHKKLRAASLATALAASMLLAATSARAEGGGDPINDQGVDWDHIRRGEANGQISNYDKAFARAHPGDPRSPRVENDRSRRFGGNRHDRGYRGNGARYHEYAYSDRYPSPYYYDPAPSPGISLFFNF
jgi:hypothetical protein